MLDNINTKKGKIIWLLVNLKILLKFRNYIISNIKKKNLLLTKYGAPDYIFSKKSELGKTVLEKPLLIAIEAKKNDFEQGWGQCLAEMIACQKINEDNICPIYGIVTDGNLWQFAKLVENYFIKDISNFTIDKLYDLYNALEYVFQLTK